MAQAEPLVVDCDFPGGNIIVERIEGDDIYVHQDLRDTDIDWFYSYFCVRGAAGRVITVHFTQSRAIGTRGPAVSTDAGRTWDWLGHESVDGNSFRYSVPEGVDEVRFCFAVPYLEADLRAFLARHEGNPHLSVETLCQTRGGRNVELLRLGQLDAVPDYRALVTCRHHCCEMMASYQLEGLMEAVLTDPQEGAWLREHVELLVVPFVDKDGVQDGDQGKNRRPHDHNRDYEGKSIYPSVAALRELASEWSKGRLRVALDLHCPHIAGESNERIYFVGVPDQTIWENVLHFSRILEAAQMGPLAYRVEDNLPFGQGWNTATNYGSRKSFSRWASELPGVEVASGMELPYANVRDQNVTPDSARATGHDLARALRGYLDGEMRGQ